MVFCWKVASTNLEISLWASHLLPIDRWRSRQTVLNICAQILPTKMIVSPNKQFKLPWETSFEAATLVWNAPHTHTESDPPLNSRRSLMTRWNTFIRGKNWNIHFLFAVRFKWWQRDTQDDDWLHLVSKWWSMKLISRRLGISFTGWSLMID